MTAAASQSNAALDGFIELRRALRRKPIGDGGLDTCRALTESLDAAITTLFPSAMAGELAVVAVGGYGRGEQCIFSDVDLMLLHSDVDISRATKTVLYPLWDAGLKVGHSVRNLPEAIAAAKDNFETLTSLLSARLVAGSDRLVAELYVALAKLIKGRPLTPKLTACERDRRERHPYPVMAANLKEDRGGLRTLQSFWWERRRAELIQAPAPHENTAEEQAARRTLLAVRNALHAVSGKAVDDFASDLRQPAAEWLAIDEWDISSRVTESTRSVDRLAMRRWPDLTAERSITSAAGRLRNRFGRRDEATARPERPLARAVAATMRPEGVRFDAIDLRAIAATGAHEWTAADRADLMTLLRRGARGRVAFGWLDLAGWVGANLPEFAHTIAAPQLAAFHEHPVDTHLWRTADEMRTLTSPAEPWFADIAAEVADPDRLLLAAFLHDIGKALPGDHSVVGAQIARTLCGRIGFAELAEPIARLIELHLLLANTATKRDTSDPRVLDEVAAACGDLRTLQSLYLLTVADARATGRTMWTHWKSTLLKNLYVRLVPRLEPPGDANSPSGRIAAIAGLAATDRDDIAAHIAAMPNGYLVAHADDEVAAHYRLAADIGAGCRVEFLDPDQPAPRLAVTAADKVGVLGAIAGVLAIHNLEVLDARLQTRSDGVACDTFHVRRLLAALPLPPAERVASDLTAALDGLLDLAAQVSAKTAPYRRSPGSRLVVRTPTDPTLRYTAIEVRCDDRPGALFEIVGELYACGLDIRMARIDTRGTEVRDLFYVLRDGEPIRDVNEIEPLISGLRRSLRARLNVVSP